MNNKRVRMLAEKAAPQLQAGEQIEISAYCNVGTVSVKRMVATAAVVAVATAGIFTAVVHPRKTYLALTTSRLLFFDVNSATGRPGKLLFTLPREAVAVADVNKGLIALKVEIAIAGQDKGLRLAFPTIAKKDGKLVASALQAAPVQV
jgi:hypothetical protein